MELKHYFEIVRRSWAVALGLPVLVAAMTMGLAFVLPQSYVITAGMLVTQRPVAAPPTGVTLPNYDLFHSWAQSEYIVDDIPQIVETTGFTKDVAAWIMEHYGRALDPERISNGLEAERQHRMIYLQVTASRAEDAEAIAQGAAAMLSENGLKYWNRADTASLEVAELEMPEKAEASRGPIRLALDVVLRSSLALLLGIGLAFLRHYLDSSIRERNEVEALGLEVIGAIPVNHGLPLLRRPQPTLPRPQLGAARQPSRNQTDANTRLP